MKTRIIPHCNCPESSEFVGLKISDGVRKKDFHKMTPTKTTRKSCCKFCGNFVFWKEECGQLRQERKHGA